MGAPEEFAGQPHQTQPRQLTALVKTRLKYSPRLVEGLIAKTGLDFQPPQPRPLKIS